MRWSPQTSSMVLLLTSQLRPLSYRLPPCTSSLRPSSSPLTGLPPLVQSLLSSVCPSNVIAMRTYSTEEQAAPYLFDQKKGALKPSLCRKEGLSAPGEVRPSCHKR